MACLLQSWDWLENRRGEDNEVFREIWKTVKAKAEKIKVVKTKEEEKKQEEKK